MGSTLADDDLYRIILAAREAKAAKGGAAKGEGAAGVLDLAGGEPAAPPPSYAAPLSTEIAMFGDPGFIGPMLPPSTGTTLDIHRYQASIWLGVVFSFLLVLFNFFGLVAFVKFNMVDVLEKVNPNWLGDIRSEARRKAYPGDSQYWNVYLWGLRPWIYDKMEWDKFKAAYIGASTKEALDKAKFTLEALWWYFRISLVAFIVSVSLYMGIIVSKQTSNSRIFDWPDLIRGVGVGVGIGLVIWVMGRALLVTVVDPMMEQTFEKALKASDITFPSFWIALEFVVHSRFTSFSVEDELKGV